MENFSLRNDETLLLQHNSAALNYENKNISVRIFLTNKNIYIQFLSTWMSRVTETRQVPLDTISFFDGSPQVYIKSVLGIEHHLVITTKSQVYDICMANMRKADIQKWVDYINKILTGDLQTTSFSRGGDSINEYTISDYKWQNFRFGDNETLLMKQDNIAAILDGDTGRSRTADLFLTDKKIYIHFHPELMKSGTKIMEIPLDSITVVEGVPQVQIYSVLGIEHHITITTKSLVLEFMMSDMRKASAQKWVDTINDILSQNMQGGTINSADTHNIDTYSDLESDSAEFEISYDVEIESKDDNEIIKGSQSEGENNKKHSFFSDTFTDTKNKKYDVYGYVIKCEKNMYHNSWNVFNNEGVCIYKIKRAMVSMRPCLRIYDTRRKQYVAEIKKHINPLPHRYDSFVWIVQGETLGIVTRSSAGKLLEQKYNADFLGWTYRVRPTKSFEILKNGTIIAKPLSTKGANPEPFEYYDLKNELGIVMMFYTHYLDIHEERASLEDRFFNP